MKVVIKPIVWFKPYQNNARTHPDSQIDMLAGLLKKHGPDQPIVTDEKGVILKGHGRRLAAIAAGIKEFPAVIRSGLSESEKSAIRIQDNQVALLSGWSAELIQSEIANLKLTGFDIPLLGFPESQLRGWGISAGTDSAQDPEIVPDLPKNPVVRRGDRWLLGDHVLYCGDSTSKSDVAACMGKAKPNLCVTDAPYGVDYDPMWRNRVKRSNGTFVGAKATGEVHGDHQANWDDVWILFQGNIIYCWHGGLKSVEAAQGLQASGFDLRSQIIWVKERLVIGRGDYHWQHEPCWYAVRKGQKGSWAGDRKQVTTWFIGAPSGWAQIKEGPDAHQGVHSTQKPIECMKRPIENNSKKGDFVYDPFMGSSTTLIACELTGRCALGIEIDSGYVQIGIERWQALTGRLATLDGKTLEQVAKARRTGTPKGKTDGAVAKQVRGVPAGVPGRPAGG